MSSGARMFKVHALIAAHADDALKFLQAFLAVAQPHRPGDVVVHRIVDLGPQARGTGSAE